MPERISPKNVNKVIKEHIRIYNELSKVDKYVDVCATNVQNAAKRYLAVAQLEMLTMIPVEELTSYGEGVPVGALRRYGFDSIGDIVSSSLHTIASVQGIDTETAGYIKDISKTIAEEVRKKVRIRLSIDDKTKEATGIVTALAQYHRAYSVALEWDRLLPEKKKTYIGIAVDELRWVTRASRIKWWFTSPKKKEKVFGAYDFLLKLLDGKYGQSAKYYIAELDSIKEISSSEAWQDFTFNSIRFFKDLEDLIPGILENNELNFGLPEELAREIQDESFFPEGLLCDLRGYQVWGVKYALHQGKTLLGDEMGLGKTVQAIAAMVSLRNTGGTHFLVICPASVLSNWCREIRKLSKLSVTQIHGPSAEAATAEWLKMGGVAVATFNSVSKIHIVEGVRIALLIVDEAHYIKNPKANRTQLVKNIIRYSDRQLLMTGTVLENRVDEMISLIGLIRPEMTRKIKEIATFESPDNYRKAVASVYYRRKREDVLTELPPLIEEEEWCRLGSEEEVAYEQAILSKNYMAARQVSWNVNDMQYSSKASRLKELVEEAVAEKRKVIVFSYFLNTIKKVSELFPGQQLLITGAVTAQKRQQILDEFKSAEPGSVLISQIESGGTGMNIQTASVIIFCEPQLKPSIEKQAVARAYRMGQTRNVLVYRLLGEGTIDEKIMKMLEKKKAEFDAYADKSVAAEHSQEVDQSSINAMIEEEIERIKEKQVLSA